jgi:hypothetical protein
MILYKLVNNSKTYAVGNRISDCDRKPFVKPANKFITFLFKQKFENPVGVKEVRVVISRLSYLFGVLTLMLCHNFRGKKVFAFCKTF